MTPESKLFALHGRSALLIGTIVCGMAVALGAFGAHALEGAIGKWYESGVAIKRLANWHTAVEYQFFHGIALICLGLWQNFTAHGTTPHRSAGMVTAMACYVAGIVFFSGGLFLWVLTASKVFVAIVPLGGLCFLLGWLAFFLTVLKQQALRT